MGRAKLLLLAAILCSFVGVTGWITWHYDQAYTLATRHTQLSAWALAQLELELHEFESAVDYYRNGRLDQERLNEAYDLAWNRLDVFLTGKEAKAVRQRFGAETLLHELFYQLQQYEPLITSPHLKPQDLEPLHQMLEGMLPKVRNLMVLNFTGPSAMRENAALEQSKAQNFVILGCLLLLGPPLIRLSHPLALLTLMPASARALGVAVLPLQLAVLGLAILVAALGAAIGGPVLFIAMAAPVIASWLMRQQTVPLWLAALCGALLLLASDTLVRLLAEPHEIPTGIMTRLLGGLLLLGLLLHDRHKGHA